MLDDVRDGVATESGALDGIGGCHLAEFVKNGTQRLINVGQDLGDLLWGFRHGWRLVWRTAARAGDVGCWGGW